MESYSNILYVVENEFFEESLVKLKSLLIESARKRRDRVNTDLELALSI